MRLVIALMWLLHWLPLPLLGRIGDLLGWLLYRLIKSRRHITLTNLRLCLPELSEAERVAIAKQHFKAYARSVLERGILWWASEARLRRLIVVDPVMPKNAMQSGPCILLCPHFVSLDVAGTAIAMEMSACSIYTRQSNALFDQALHKGRTRFKPVKIFARSEGIKPIIRAMRANLPFFMLPDMDFGLKDAAFVPFFGIQAATLTAAPRIASMTGAKVIPVIASMLPNYRGWKITFHPAWDNYPGDDIIAATARMNQFIEAEIRKNPAEYFWTHRRFKTRPNGEACLY
jgi:KDO2-lipid IV(A) lauroyltransferase